LGPAACGCAECRSTEFCYAECRSALVVPVTMVQQKIRGKSGKIRENVEKSGKIRKNSGKFGKMPKKSGKMPKKSGKSGKMWKKSGENSGKKVRPDQKLNFS
jgi:hypothetical protein